MDKQSKPEKLDVENDDARQRRLQNAFRKLNRQTTYSTKAVASPSFTSDKPVLISDTSDDLLPRVQAFLPRIEASNAVLAKRIREDPDSVNMENVRDQDTHYIQLNLGLGVFEGCKGMDVDEANLSSASSNSSTATSSPSDDTSEFDYDSDASSEIITCFVPSRPIRPLPRRRRRPGIVLLGD